MRNGNKIKKELQLDRVKCGKKRDTRDPQKYSKIWKWTLMNIIIRRGKDLGEV